MDDSFDRGVDAADIAARAPGAGGGTCVPVERSSRLAVASRYRCFVSRSTSADRPSAAATAKERRRRTRPGESA